MSELSLHLTVTGVVLLVLGAVHAALPRTLRWTSDLAGTSLLNRQVTYVHCYFIGLACLLWGLLALTAGPELLEPEPVTRLVLIGAVAFWASRLLIQVVVFNRHARESKAWCVLSVAGTVLWLYLTVVWSWALSMQL
jgi:hypothetical protein